MSKKTQILHVVTNISDGGLEKVVYLIISNLQTEELVHNVAVLTKNDNGFLYEKFKDLGVNIINFNFQNKSGLLESLTGNVRETFRLAYLYKKLRVDVLHTHDFFPAFVSRTAVLVSILFFFHRTKKIFVTLHNVFFWLKPIHHKINKFYSIFTTKIICVSKSVLDYSKSHDKIKNEKYELLYNGVEIDNFEPSDKIGDELLREFNYSENDFIIGNVGVLSVRKGQKYLLNAFARIVQKYPNCKLLIFGSERQHELDIANEVRGIISSNGLDKSVTIFKPREDINKVYNVFDLFVMPSISEGMSLSAMEALLMGRLCLFSDIGPFKEMVEEGDNKNAFLFKSQDGDDLYKKMDYIISNYKSLSQVKSNARREALQKYDVRSMVKNYEKLYLS